ncbi:MAG: hypothetical protein RR851_08255 [Clostridium sp.]
MYIIIGGVIIYNKEFKKLKSYEKKIKGGKFKFFFKEILVYNIPLILLACIFLLRSTTKDINDIYYQLSLIFITAGSSGFVAAVLMTNNRWVKINKYVKNNNDSNLN